MATVTLLLPNPNGQSAGNWVQWDERNVGYGDISVFASPAGESRHLIRLRIFRPDAQVQFQVIDTPDGSSGFGSSEELSDAWEEYSEAITVQASGVSPDLVISGPNDPRQLSAFDDEIEPYAWRNVNAINQRDWFDAYEAAGRPSVTITLDDGVAPVAVAHAVDAGDINWTFSLPQPTVTHTTPTPIAHAVDAGDINWTFSLPQPTVTHTTPAAMVVMRLDSIAALDALFNREDTSNGSGTWLADAGGTTPSSNTGPGTNSVGSYVYSESSGSDSTLPDISELTALSAIMAAWTGNGRILALRACMQGQGTYPNNSASGLQIQGRDSDSDAWATIDLLEGWDYSNTRTTGDTVTDSLGIVQTIAQDGGWVDFEVTIPDSYQQLRLRNIPAPGGQSFLHDAALWQIEFRDGIVDSAPTVAVAHAVDAGDINWEFTLPQPTVTLVLSMPTAHAVDAGDINWTFTLPQPTVTHTTPTPIAHAVDAGDISWTFSLPQPTVTHTTALPIAHAVDAGDIEWEFTLPQPTVTLVRSMPTAHAVDAGDISWTFDLPQPTVTLTKPSAVAYAIDAGDISWLFTLPQPTVTHVSSISPPAAPTAPTAADIGLDFVTIEWTPPASDAALTDYEVRIGLTGAWTSIESRTPRYRFGSLAKGTEYTFYVRAWSANGVGSASGGLTVTTHKGYVTDGLDVTGYGDLAILQWREARNFRIKIDTFLKIAQKRIIEPLRWIETHRSLPDAEGFMLDALGSKLGEDDGKRPSVSISGVNFFGFSGSGSTGFNQGKFKSVNPLLAREPAGDTFYRGLLTLAYGALLTDSSQESLDTIVKMVWADAEYRDLGTSAEFIATDTPTGLIDLADELGLLPRPSGVSLAITKL